MANLDFMRQRIRRGSVQRIRRAAPVLERRLRAEAPVAEDGGGAMRDATTATARGLSVEVRVAVDYASYVIEGTPPHRIDPPAGKFLAFFWDNPRAERMGRLPDGRVLSRGVMHPGTDANDWYHPVIDEWPRILERTPV